MIKTNWCILTGAPCSGKTSVLNELKKRGFKCIPEVARVYIEQELSKGHTINEIRADEAAFQKKIIEIKKQIELDLVPEEIVFLDRAIPDSISYLRIAGMDAAEVIELSKKFRYSDVFIFDPVLWEQDAARNEDAQTVALLDRQLETDYLDLGYEPIRIPVVPIKDRIEMVLSKINQTYCGIE